MPYAFFSLIHLAVVAPSALARPDGLEQMVSHLFHVLLLNNDGMPIAGALWFLTALWFCDVGFALIARAERMRRGLWLEGAVCLGLFWLGCMPFASTLPWSLGCAFMGFGFYWAGRVLRLWETRGWAPTRMGVAGAVALLVVATVLALVSPYVNMRTCEAPLPVVCWAVAILNTVAWWNVCRLCSDAAVDWSPGNVVVRLKAYLIAVGRNSITYLCLNQIVVLGVDQVFALAGMDAVHGFALLAVTIGVLVASMLLLTLADSILQHTRL